MGLFGSSEESSEQKQIDTAGNVNNNIIIQQEANDVHHQMLISEKLLMASYCLILLEIGKLSICLFSAFKRNIKKRYQKSQIQNV